MSAVQPGPWWGYDTAQEAMDAARQEFQKWSDKCHRGIDVYIGDSDDTIAAGAAQMRAWRRRANAALAWRRHILDMWEGWA